MPTSGDGRTSHVCVFAFVRIRSLVACHGKLKNLLSMSKDDTAKTEDLLQVVRSLCCLDDALAGQDLAFEDIYRGA